MDSGYTLVTLNSSVKPTPKKASWVPFWLRTEKLSFPDGTPRPAFGPILRFHNYFLISGLLVVIIATVTTSVRWSTIDAHLCPDQTSCKFPCLINADADIAGIGVRYATYIQSFCTVVLLGFSPGETDAHAVRATLVITNLGITATASIFALQGSLSLPHAMVVVSLLTQSLFPINIIESWTVRSPGLFIAQQARLLIYTILSVWLVTKTPCLGSTPQCNLCTVSVTWFSKTKATNHLRRSATIFTSSAVVIVWLGSTFWYLGYRTYLRSYVAVLYEERRDIRIHYLKNQHDDMQHWRSLQPKADLVSKFYLWYDEDQTLYEGLKSRRWKVAPIKAHDRRQFRTLLQNLWLAVQIPRIHRTILAIAFTAIFTYDTERVVKLNLDSNANEWGYGQISAMILCGPSVAAVLKLFVSAWRAEKIPIKRAYTL